MPTAQQTLGRSCATRLEAGRRRQWRRSLPIDLAAATAMLVGERDARLGFIHSLPDQIHRSGTMTALVRGGFPPRTKRLVERRQRALHIALIGLGGFRGCAEQADGSYARCSYRCKAATREF